MGKMKESYSNLYYSSQDDFFSDLESGQNQPTYVGLLEIVRVLKLISSNSKKNNPAPEHPTPPAEPQLSFTELAGAS